MTMTQMGDPLIGHVLDGRYEVTDRVARGGMATVYLATDQRLTRTVAVKVMQEGLGADEDFVAKFDREARSAARLSHPNVVSVFDQGHDGDRPYIVMEHIAGGTLRQLMNRAGVLEPLRALELIEPVLAALAAAHEAGIVHRDVKPENVLITDRGQLKVADFGLARAISAQTITANQGLLIGTVSYLPPELVLHGRATPRSDVYSAGVVLFEMLTGSKPHTGDTPIQVAWAHVHNDIEPPSQRLDTSWRHTRTAIPPYLDALVQSATRREPTQRPADARGLLAAVREARAALGSGVMDDPALTARFRSLAPFDGADDRTQAFDRPTQVRDTQVRDTPVRPARPPRPATPVHTPLSPSVPWAERSTDRATPVPIGPPPEPGRTALLPAQPDEPRAPSSPSRHRRELVERQRRRRRRGWIWLVLLTLLVLLAAATGWWFAEGRFTAAPTVAGMTQAQASDAVRQAALQPRTTERFSEDVPAGAVIGTEPAGGSRLERDSALTLVVSKGPERFEAPEVVGSSLDDARSAIESASLKVGKISERWDEKAKKGTVLSADPKAGSSLKRDSTVNLAVSKGPEPIKIGDWVGKGAEEARDALTEKGFKINEKTANSDSVPKDRVISQDPESGTAFRGDTITIVRSLGPELVQIPEVKTKSVDEATKLLKEAGFKVESKPGPQYLGLGYVMSVEPTESGKAPKGSTITLLLV
ncbi:Stk1 family PASTA domain-containing Ser/Thr kinase [Naumannella huperziae]